MLLLATGWVARAWKLPVALSAIVALLAAFGHYCEARDVWLATHQMPPSPTSMSAGRSRCRSRCSSFFFFAATVATAAVRPCSGACSSSASSW